MSTFAEKMNKIAQDALEHHAVENEGQAASNKADRIETVKKTKFEFFKEKYLESIIGGIERTAAKGENKKFVNFNREDFKANCYGLGFPHEFLRMWLTEVSNPNSIYALENEDGSPRCLEGIKFSIWNNQKFTVVFEW
jgi:hypothetical protein